MDDDDEIGRLLDVYDMPSVADDVPHNGVGAPLTELEELGDWE